MAPRPPACPLECLPPRLGVLRWARGLQTIMAKRKHPVECNADSCQRNAVARGLCKMHWKRHRKHGDVDYAPTLKASAFWSFVKIGGADECWPWTGPTRGEQVKYGGLTFRGKHEGAHRVAWILTNGELPALPGADYRGTCVLHRCDFGLCCNPGHLFLGTHDDNMKDKASKGRDTNKNKKHCRHGHERNERNTYVTSSGLRMCRVCNRIRQAIRNQLQQGEARCSS